MEKTEQPQSAPAANPASGSSQFPIRKLDGRQFSSAEELHGVLEKEISGHYLLGSYNFWHGGIHITDASAPQCRREEPVRAIADGVVVAYRLNRAPLKSKYKAADLQYSTSFCLIRHEYHSPINSEEGANKGKQNSLTYYSLYMHLLPHAEYGAVTAELRNPRIKMDIGGYVARSDLPGEPDCVKYGTIAAGASFEILEEKSSGSELVYARGKLLSGKITDLPDSNECWFAYKQKGGPVKNKANKPIWSLIPAVQHQPPDYWQGKITATVTAGKGLNVRNAPETLAHGQPVGARMYEMALRLNSQISFDSSKVLNLRLGDTLVRMAECKLVSGALTRAVGELPATFWCCVEDQGAQRVVKWSKPVPSTFDSVVFCEAAIKAGDPVGYLGHYEVISEKEGDKLSKHQVHLEVFSADPRLPAFLKNPAGLKQGKQFLRLPANTVLSAKAAASQNTTLSQSHLVELNKAPLYKDPQNVEWYELTLTDSGNTVSGLIRKDSLTTTETGPQLICQHDWQKLGFQTVEEHNPDTDGYLDPDDMPDFFKTLYREIDSSRDGQISPEELASAMTNPRLRDRWSRLIGRHRSEWKGGSSSPMFARMEELMANHPEAIAHEKERVDNLMFWDEVATKVGLPEDGRVWHFHPVELIRSIDRTEVICNKCTQMIGLTFELLRPLVSSQMTDEFVNDLVEGFNEGFKKYKVASCSQIVNILAQAKHETLSFSRFKESLMYTKKRYTGKTLYDMAKTAINAGFISKGLAYTEQQKIKYIEENLLDNDLAYGQHSFGHHLYPKNDYRGRGIFHLTHYSNYHAFAKYSGVNVDEDPVQVEKDIVLAVESGLWYWKVNAIGEVADRENMDLDSKIRAITKKINAGLKGLKERSAFTKEINESFSETFGQCMGE